MTVKELIDKLNEIPKEDQNASIYLSDDEGKGFGLLHPDDIEFEIVKKPVDTTFIDSIMVDKLDKYEPHELMKILVFWA